MGAASHRRASGAGARMPVERSMRDHVMRSKTGKTEQPQQRDQADEREDQRERRPALQRPPLPLPHEIDQTTKRKVHPPANVMKQAEHDVEQGQQDTDL